jgi:hypothetical protein
LGDWSESDIGSQDSLSIGWTEDLSQR